MTTAPVFIPSEEIRFENVSHAVNSSMLQTLLKQLAKTPYGLSSHGDIRGSVAKASSPQEVLMLDVLLYAQNTAGTTCLFQVMLSLEGALLSYRQLSPKQPKGTNLNPPTPEFCETLIQGIESLMSTIIALEDQDLLQVHTGTCYVLAPWDKRA